MGKTGFNYYNPAKLLSGKKALEGLSFELKSLEVKKPVVLCLKSDREQGRDKILIRAFYESGITLGAVIDDEFTDGACDNFADICKLFSERGCDSIIFMGNGRSGNAARLLKLVLDAGMQVLNSKGDVEVPGTRYIPVIAVPTGVSDTDVYSPAAFYRDMRANSGYLLPDVICIDPRMTVSKKTEEAAANAMGAFALAMDALFISENPFVTATSGMAVKFIMQYLPVMMKKPGNKEASFGVCNGIITSAMGIINSEQGLMGHLASSYRTLYGSGSPLLASAVFKTAFDIYTADSRCDVSRILLSLTGPDEAASVLPGEKMKRVKELVEQILKITAADAGEAARKIRLSPDEAGKIAAEAGKNAGKSFSKQDFEILLKKVTG